MQFNYASGSLILGDCLDVMRRIPSGSVDMVLCDLPYGTTACKWDTVIPFEPLWAEYWRVCKPNAAVVLTAAQPFTSALVMSQIAAFRFAMVWDKINRYTGALHANRYPLKRHEDVLLFAKKSTTYNKQMRQGKPYKVQRTGGLGAHVGDTYNDRKRIGINDGSHNPCSIIEIEGDNKHEMGLHPTQKPVALFEYLIKTYSNPGELILDNCAGSGTTAIAAHRSGRRSLLIERELQYFLAASGRIYAECNG